ncbi:MAG: hypothetical protein MZU97_20300 [Bacillus subtilis]|nr:hypothetical protein [Bacillus subtilis]
MATPLPGISFGILIYTKTGSPLTLALFTDREHRASSDYQLHRRTVRRPPLAQTDRSSHSIISLPCCSPPSA